jgi:hypothetical protein
MNDDADSPIIRDVVDLSYKIVSMHSTDFRNFLKSDVYHYQRLLIMLMKFGVKYEGG